MIVKKKILVIKEIKIYIMWTKVDKLAIFTNNDKILKFKNVRINNIL